MKELTRSLKLKLYPTKEQCKQINNHIDGNRWLYNFFLEKRIELYKNENKSINYYHMANYLAELKDIDEYKWLNNIHSQSLQQTLKRLDKAFINFFRRVRNHEKPGFPKFKSKKYDRLSYTYPQGIKFNNVYSKVYLPKIGWIKCRGYRQFNTDKYKQLIITAYRDGLIEASCILSCENQADKNSTSLSIGIDVGTRKFITDSNGNSIPPINLTSSWDKIKYLQQSLTKQVAGSNNYDRNQKKLAKEHRRLSNIRTNWLHHVANKYLDYRVVYVEDLNIKQMSTNTVGTFDNPNYDSKRKSRLNHKILEQSWGMFFNIVSYKLSARGSLLYKVEPTYTSQICSSCGKASKESRNGEHYKCVHCGYEIDADWNAAINIHNRGLTQLDVSAA